MKIHNYEIKKLIEFLYNEELNAKQSRIRTRFLKLLLDREAEINEFRVEYLKKYAKKNENGEVLFLDNDPNKGVDLESPEDFYKEYNELLNEEFIIDETPEREEMLIGVRNIILNTNKTFNGDGALEYDRFCEIFENIYGMESN